MADIVLALVLALTAALFTDIGFALLKVRGDTMADRTGGRFREVVTAYAGDPLWLLGLLFQPIGYGFYFWALEMAPLNVVQTTMSSGVVLFVGIAVYFLGEWLTPREWGAIVAVVVGMVLLGISLSPEAETSQSGIDPLAILYLSLILIGVCLAAWLTLAGTAGPGGRGIALGIASGLLLGLASVYAKGLALHLTQSPSGELFRSVVTSPYTLLTLLANLAGFSLLLGAFRGERAAVVVSLCGTLSNIVPILGGMLALGERLPAEPFLAASRLLAFVLTLGGAGLLVRVSSTSLN